MIPLLINHDPTAIIGTVVESGPRLIIRMDDGHALTRQMLHFMFGNCGYRVINAEGDLISMFEILEFSFGPIVQAPCDIKRYDTRPTTGGIWPDKIGRYVPFEEYEKLHTAFVEAQKDTARLDFIAKHPRPSEVRADGKVEKGYMYAVAGNSMWTLREIIDTIMKRSKQ